MRFDESRPIYRQIADEVCRRVVRGEWRPGERVPSVRDLALGLGVNPNTVQRAYQELEREGVLVTRRGEGSFVGEAAGLVEELRERMVAQAVREFLGDMQAMGMTAEEGIRWIRRLAEELWPSAGEAPAGGPSRAGDERSAEDGL